jgi:hypothetical protein
MLCRLVADRLRYNERCQIRSILLVSLHAETRMTCLATVTECAPARLAGIETMVVPGNVTRLDLVDIFVVPGSTMRAGR